MQLDIIAHSPDHQVIFDEKAVKNVSLNDDILHITYKTKIGGLETIMCPDISDVEYFLLNTVTYYHEDYFSPNLLLILAKSLETLKYRIKSFPSGFGKLHQLNYARFLIAESIENIYKIKLGQESATITNIYKADVDFDKESVCISYKNQTAKDGQIDHLLLFRDKSKINYNDVISFIENCLPMFNSENMTFGQAAILCEELYNIHLNKIKNANLH